MSNPQNGSGLQSATTDVAATGRHSMDTVLGPTKWGGVPGQAATITFSFPWTVSSSATWATARGGYSTDNEPNQGFGLTAVQQAGARQALQAWADVANVRFLETTETASSVGDIRFAWTNATLPNASAWAYEPDNYYASGGDIWLSAPAIKSLAAKDWQPGGDNFGVLIHEVGHSIGLKHPFEDGVVAAGVENTQQYTAMAYDAHPHGTFLRVTQTGRSVSAVAWEVQPDGPMLNDVLAAQYLYGPNLTTRAGDDVYTFDANVPFLHTIWDAAGSDTISVANFSKPCTIDLREGHFSKVTIESDPMPPGLAWRGTAPVITYDGTDNLAIAWGAVIENAVGGVAGDILQGNSASNHFTGGGGNDALLGDTGLDVANYAGPLSRYKVSQTFGGYTVADGTAAEGTDALNSIERLVFSDTYLALDMDANQHGGQAALLLGAVLGRDLMLARPGIIRVGLDLLDQGASVAAIAGAILRITSFWDDFLGSHSNQTLAHYFLKTVYGAEPDAATLTQAVTAMDHEAFQGDYLAQLSLSAANQQQVGLVGLAQTGLAYS